MNDFLNLKETFCCLTIDEELCLKEVYLDISAYQKFLIICERLFYMNREDFKKTVDGRDRRFKYSFSALSADDNIRKIAIKRIEFYLLNKKLSKNNTLNIKRNKI